VVQLLVLVVLILVVLVVLLVLVVLVVPVQVDWVTLVDRPLAGVPAQREEQLVLQEVQLQEGGQLPQEVQLQRALSVLPEPPQREEKGEEESMATETTCTEATITTTIMSIALSLEDGHGRTLTTVMVTSGSSCVPARPGLGLLLVTQSALGLLPESVHQRVVIWKKRKKLVVQMNALKVMKATPLLV